MDTFVKRLNQLIKENKTSKYRIAKELQCSKQTVCNWADGMAEPKLSHIKALAEYFDVTSDYLIGLEDENGSKTSTFIQNNTINGGNNIIKQGGKK